jgi:predicted transposase YbfD/YdcC
LSRVPGRLACTVLKGPQRSNALGLPDNGLHWVRDVTFAEDLSQIHTGAAPQVMASLRNLAISLHRLARATNIAKALRHHSRNAHRPINLLKII